MEPTLFPESSKNRRSDGVTLVPLDPSLLNQNVLLQLGGAFLAGVVSFLSPCVFPLVPITIASCLSGETEEPSKRSFWYALSRTFPFFLGIVVIYTTLGLMASSAGGIFGSLVGEGPFRIAVSGVLVILALYTLGGCRLPFFAWMQRVGHQLTVLPGGSSAFFLGATSGLLAAPCVGPLLIAILSVAASADSVWLGGILLCTYAIGMGLPFLFLGSLARVMHSWPRSGLWMEWVKAAAGVGILLTASFLLTKEVNDVIASRFISLFPVALAGVAAFGFLFLRHAIRHQRIGSRVLGVLLISLPLHVVLFGGAPRESSIPWNRDIESALLDASAQQKPLFVFFHADWCPACQYLKAEIFPNQDSENAFKKVVPVMIDLTVTEPHSSEVAARFSVMGVPTVVVLDEDGNEIPSARHSGLFSTKELVAIIGRAGSATTAEVD